MSLTVLKLDEGRYYYTSNGIEKAHYCNVNGCSELVTPKGEILSPVPWFGEYLALKDENQEFCTMLKECRQYLYFHCCDHVANLLTRINAVIGESEE